jgi:ATP-dependent exoDNAse (exonuclease V) alpha subunit
MEEIKETEEFAEIFKMVNMGKNRITLLTGKAGTGKSTMITYLKGKMGHRNIVVVAPTGIAALNVGGQTIHSFFRLPTPPLLTDRDIHDFGEKADLLKKIDLLIIDEISMVRADVLDAINWTLQFNRDSYEPFGGVRVLLVGDFFQLPPVVTSDSVEALDHNYQSPYFFHSDVLFGNETNYFELTYNFRQNDQEFINFLDKVRVNTVNLKDIYEFNSKCYNRDLGKPLILSTVNKKTDKINISELEKIDSPLKTFRAEITGNFKLDKKMPSPVELDLKIGAKVMFTKNDKEGRWVNGTIGTVKDFKDGTILVEVDEIVHRVEISTWSNNTYKWDAKEKKITTVSSGEYKQYPLRLAWAVTIHKSQGLTLDKVQIDFGRGAFASGQAYVALSRCKTLEGISLAKEMRISDVIVDNRISQFYKENFACA